MVTVRLPSITHSQSMTHSFSGRINVMRERIERKDDLLQGYETDLAKLRSTVNRLVMILYHRFCLSSEIGLLYLYL